MTRQKGATPAKLELGFDRPGFIGQSPLDPWALVGGSVRDGTVCLGIVESGSTNCVTVIIPAYNAETLVADAVTSALEQLNVLGQVIVVDDGSTDRTAEIVASIAAVDSRLVLIRATNGGPARARNLALAETTTPYVSWLDADDYFADNLHLDNLVRLIEANDSSFVYSNSTVTADSKAVPFHSTAYEPAVDVMDLFRGGHINMGTVLVRVESVRRVGGFRVDDRFSLSEDAALWIDLAMSDVLPLYSAHVGVVRRVQPTSRSTQNVPFLKSKIALRDSVLQQLLAAGTISDDDLGEANRLLAEWSIALARALLDENVFESGRMYRQAQRYWAGVSETSKARSYRVKALKTVVGSTPIFGRWIRERPPSG